MNARSINSSIGFLFVCACIIGFTPASRADSYVVPPGTSGANPVDPYSSWATAATNIQTAVNAAATSGWSAVWVSNGTYTLTEQVVITNAIALRSWHDGATDREGTVIDGNAAVRCLFIGHNNALLDGFTISNGYAAAADWAGHGGGIYMTAGAMLTNCLFVNNAAAGYGGGVFMTNTAAWMANCHFYDNSAVNNGGGIHLERGGNTIAACVFSNNAGAFGGGISVQGWSDASTGFELSACVLCNNRATGASPSQGGGGFFSINHYGQMMITGCVFRGNTTAASGGGALWVRRSRGTQTPQIRNCIFENNVSSNADILSSGGGVGLSQSKAFLSECLISSNYSTLNGGGLFIQPYSTLGVLVDRCTIVSNKAIIRGGGVLTYTVDSATNNADTIIRNSLIAWNVSGRHGGGGIHMWPIGALENCTIASNQALHATDGWGGGVIVRVGGSSRRIINTIIYANTAEAGGTNWWIDGPLTASNSCSVPALSAYGSGNLEADPAFKDLAAGNFRLAGGSPCINAGLLQDWMADAKDLDGQPRLRGLMRRVDMGAYENVERGAIFLLR